MEKYELHSVTEGTTGAMDVIFHKYYIPLFYNPKRRRIETMSNIRI